MLLLLLVSYLAVTGADLLSYQVMIQARDGESSDHCGAVLVDYSWALTTAMCVERLFKNFKDIEVIAGFGQGQDQPEHQAAERYVHRSENDDVYNVALVRVKKPFTKSDSLQVAKLPKKGNAICRSPETAVTIPDVSGVGAKARMFFKFWAVKVIGKVLLKKVAQKLLNSLNATLVSIEQELKERWERANATQRLITLLQNKAKEETSKAAALAKKKIDDKLPLKGLRRVLKKIWGWFRGKRDTASSSHSSTFTGLMPKGPPEVCAGSKGWPLYCGDTVFAVEAKCEMSGSRAGEELLSYLHVDPELEFIATTTGAKVNLTQKGIKGRGEAVNIYNGRRQLVLMVVVGVAVAVV